MSVGAVYGVVVGLSVGASLVGLALGFAVGVLVSFFVGVGAYLGGALALSRLGGHADGNKARGLFGVSTAVGVGVAPVAAVASMPPTEESVLIVVAICGVAFVCSSLYAPHK